MKWSDLCVLCLHRSSYILSFRAVFIWVSKSNWFIASTALSSGQTIATYHHNICQHCWPSICKLQPNDRNIVGARLATLLRSVSARWVLKVELVRMPGRNIVARTWPNDCNTMEHPQTLRDHFQIWAKNIQHVAMPRNRVAKRAQHSVPNSAAICCVQMLRSFGRGFTLLA